MNCFAPHSRHTEVRENDIREVKELTLLANSEEAGVHLVIGPKEGKCLPLDIANIVVRR